jgi:hypothetical protein
MVKLTPEIEAKIKASGIPIIEITMEILKNAKIAETPPKIKKKI